MKRTEKSKSQQIWGNNWLVGCLTEVLFLFKLLEQVEKQIRHLEKSKDSKLVQILQKFITNHENSLLTEALSVQNPLFKNNRKVIYRILVIYDT